MARAGVGDEYCRTQEENHTICSLKSQAIIVNDDKQSIHLNHLPQAKLDTCPVNASTAKRQQQ